RMGAFKPLLPFGNSTVVESCIDYLRRGGAETILIVAGHERDQLQRHLEGQRVLFAVNDDPASEMAASIARGIEEVPMSAAAVIVALTDQPAVPASVVSELINYWTSGATIIKPEYEHRGGHPVLIDLSYRTELANLPAASGLKTFFSVHRAEVCRVPVETQFIARDMDTWDDYLALHLEVFGFLPPEELARRPN
ncbi:MAG TPA: nucleotidyltransferase family protein, partial [Pyrinomonadaceae bacterium]